MTAPDRGSRALTRSGAPTRRFGATLLNHPAAPLRSFAISFVGEQWRQTANAQTLTFDYQVGATSLTTGTWTSVSALNFTAINVGTSGSLDGNNVVDRTSKSTKLGVTVANGQEFWLRWSKTGTSSPGLAIDDFSLTPTNTISGTLFNGPNGVGSPITGRTITLLQNGTSIGSTTTNGSGDY